MKFTFSANPTQADAKADLDHFSAIKAAEQKIEDYNTFFSLAEQFGVKNAAMIITDHVKHRKER